MRPRVLTAGEAMALLDPDGELAYGATRVHYYRHGSAASRLATAALQGSGDWETPPYSLDPPLLEEH
jgi:hypothetical protein